jgi:hypothetical protein
MCGAALLVALLIAAACDGGSGGDNDTPTPDASPTPAATSTPVPIPVRPAAFEDYAPAIAAYLSADPARGEGDACLNELYATWEMSYFSGGRSCRNGNADADADDELAAVLVETRGDACVEPVRYRVAIFDREGGEVGVAHQTDVATMTCATTNWLGNVVVAIADISGDGTGDLAYQEYSCGASTCVTSVHVITGGATGYRALTPVEGASIETPLDVRFEDPDGDGVQSLLLHGGDVQSAGAGPQRPRTDVYQWDGTSYRLSSSVPDEATYRYHAVVDANAFFAEPNYREAEQLYLNAVDDAELRAWKTDIDERAELSAYALFRAGVAALMDRDDAATANAHFDRAIAIQPSLHAQLAGSFKAAYDAGGDVSIACAAVNEDVRANLTEYQAFWDFGYANPPFDPAAVCPF